MPRLNRRRSWLRRAKGDVSRVLTAQRAYAQRLAERSQYGLMVPEAFVRGIRDIGYRSNGDAIAELVDNALQALATRVDVIFGYAGAKSTKKRAAGTQALHGLDCCTHWAMLTG